MSTPVSQMKQQIEDATRVLDAAEDCAFDLADMLRGRLRAVSKSDRWGRQDILRDLKRELQDFNAVTGTWRAAK